MGVGAGGAAEAWPEAGHACESPGASSTLPTPLRSPTRSAPGAAQRLQQPQQPQQSLQQGVQQGLQHQQREGGFASVSVPATLGSRASTPLIVQPASASVTASVTASVPHTFSHHALLPPLQHSSTLGRHEQQPQQPQQLQQPGMTDPSHTPHALHTSGDQGPTAPRRDTFSPGGTLHVRASLHTVVPVMQEGPPAAGAVSEAVLTPPGAWHAVGCSGSGTAAVISVGSGHTSRMSASGERDSCELQGFGEERGEWVWGKGEAGVRAEAGRGWVTREK